MKFNLSEHRIISAAISVIIVVGVFVSAASFSFLRPEEAKAQVSESFWTFTSNSLRPLLTSWNVGVGTGTPGSILSIQGAANFKNSGTSTIYTPFNFPVLNATSTTASSTFSNGLVVYGGTLQLSKMGACNGTSVLETDANGVLQCGADASGGLNIGDAVTGGTAGSALFVDGSGNLGQDNTNFFWNDTTDRLGLGGTTTPGSLLSLQGVANFGAGTSTVYSGILSRGLTASSSLTVLSGGAFNINAESFTDLTGTGLQLVSGALTLNATGDWTGTLDGIEGASFLRSDASDSYTSGTLTFDAGTALDLNTTTLTIADTGIAFDGASTDFAFTGNWSVNTNHLFIDKTSGNVGIATTTPGSILSVQGAANFQTAATSTIYTPLRFPNFNATSTAANATSTIAGSLQVATSNGMFSVGTTTATTTNGGAVFGGQVSTCQKVITPAATVTVDWSACNKQSLILSQAGHTINFANGKPGQSVLLEVFQDGTGNRTITTWGGGILFLSSNTTTTATSTPGLTTKAGTCNLFSFTTSSGTSTLVYMGGLPMRCY